jgi:SHS2 domain-containing protein
METEFEILDHTADTGIVAYGNDLKEAFASAAKGMFSLITSLETVKNTESRKIEISSPDRESLLVNWLNELIYLFDVDNLLFSEFRIDRLENNSLTATANGEKVDPSRHELRTGIKAATYHMLEITEKDTCRVQVLFDL